MAAAFAGGSLAGAARLGAAHGAGFFLAGEDAATIGGAITQGEAGGDEGEGEECFHGGV